MKEQTIYIPTPVSQKPEKEGWYDLIQDFPNDIRSTSAYFYNGVWHYTKAIAHREEAELEYDISDNYYDEYTHWLRPTTLPQELAAKDKEIAEIKAFSKQAIELLTDNHKLENEKRDKEIATLREEIGVGQEMISEYGHMKDRLFECLSKLVELKKVKDVEGKTEQYERERPVAWEKAQRLIENYIEIIEMK